VKDTRRVPSVKHGDDAHHHSTFYRTCAAIPVAIAIVFSQRMFQDLDRQTGSDYYLAATHRDGIWTDWFPVSNLIVFTALNVWGFWFVNWATLKSPEPCRAWATGSQTAICWLIGMSPILFYFAGMYAMRSRYQAYASCQGLAVNNYVAWLSDNASAPDCDTYSDDAIFEYNLFYYLPGFFVGLHWTHVADQIHKKSDGHEAAKWGKKAMFAVLSGLVYYWLNDEHVDANVETYYDNYFTFIVKPYLWMVPTFFLVQELVFAGMLHNDVPIWTLAAVVVPILAGGQSEEHTAVIGLYMGVVVEGIARRGMMVWKPWDRLELWWAQDESFHLGHDDEPEEEVIEEEDVEEAADAEEEQWGEDF